MGKKINPKVFRISVTKNWPSKWFSVGQEYIKNIEQDVQVRRFIIKKLREAGVDRVEIERNANKINVNIYTAKPGFIIGRGGAGAEPGPEGGWPWDGRRAHRASGAGDGGTGRPDWRPRDRRGRARGVCLRRRRTGTGDPECLRPGQSDDGGPEPCVP